MTSHLALPRRHLTATTRANLANTAGYQFQAGAHAAMPKTFVSRCTSYGCTSVRFPTKRRWRARRPILTGGATMRRLSRKDLSRRTSKTKARTTFWIPSKNGARKFKSFRALYSAFALLPHSTNAYGNWTKSNLCPKSSPWRRASSQNATNDNDGHRQGARVSLATW